MQSAGREPSMEDILASIKKVIAEEKDLRVATATAAPPPPPEQDELPEDSSEEVLELDQPLAPAVDLGPPLLDQDVADSSRQSLAALSTIAASAPPQPPVNPLEDMIRELLRPILKQWLDDHLPGIVDEHVKREITRITGRPV